MNISYVKLCPSIPLFSIFQSSIFGPKTKKIVSKNTYDIFK